LAYQGREATATQQTQASTAALITLLVSSLWVLAVVARPYEWWRVILVAVSALAYVVIFSIPPARELFMLNVSNVTLTSMALGIGLVGVAAIEAIWWVQGRLLGERRRLWKQR
jgi:cation-transporting ATPase E